MRDTPRRVALKNKIHHITIFAYLKDLNAPLQTYFGGTLSELMLILTSIH